MERICYFYSGRFRENGKSEAMISGFFTAASPINHNELIEHIYKEHHFGEGTLVLTAFNTIPMPEEYKNA